MSEASAVAQERGEWFFRLVGRLSDWMPSFLAAFLARWVLGVSGTARTSVHLSTPAIQRISLALSGAFLARVAVRLTPEARELVLPRLPFEAVFRAAKPLIAEREFVITARFAELLPRTHLKQLVVQLNDMEGVAHIAGHLPPEKAADVLMAFSPHMAARLLEEVVGQGYRELTAELGPLLPRGRLERILPLLSEAACTTITARVPQSRAGAA